MKKQMTKDSVLFYFGIEYPPLKSRIQGYLVSHYQPSLLKYACNTTQQFFL